jgi:hypothetical protein
MPDSDAGAAVLAAIVNRSLGVAEDAAKEVYGLHAKFRRSSAAVATSREGHRLALAVRYRLA